jgi:hypothetical protein
MKYGNFAGACPGFHPGYKAVAVGDPVRAQFAASQVLLGTQL